ncbi:hypothetical protein BJX99DRAFT_224738 [Aspergillus californicus]
MLYNKLFHFVRFIIPSLSLIFLILFRDIKEDPPSLLEGVFSYSKQLITIDSNKTYLPVIK